MRTYELGAFSSGILGTCMIIYIKFSAGYKNIPKYTEEKNMLAYVSSHHTIYHSLINILLIRKEPASTSTLDLIKI